MAPLIPQPKHITTAIMPAVSGVLAQVRLPILDITTVTTLDAIVVAEVISTLE